MQQENTDTYINSQATREWDMFWEYFRHWKSTPQPNYSLADLSKDFELLDVPELPIEPSDYIQFIQDNILPHTVNLHNTKYMGHMTAPVPEELYPIALLLLYLNQNVVKVETSQALTLLERQLIGVFHQLVFELPEAFYAKHVQNQQSCLGVGVSGGSLANLTALNCLLNSVLKPDGVFDGLAKRGLLEATAHYGFKKMVLLGSHLAHYSFQKAASVLGLGTDNFIELPSDGDGSVQLSALEHQIAQCKENNFGIVALVGVAGSTETGSIDPLVEMGKIAQKYNIPFHIDAAWGGPLLFSHSHKELLKGIAYADVVTICGHKQLYLPMGYSLCLFKDPKMALFAEFNANYQARKRSWDTGKHTIEGSRPAHALYLHAYLQLFGRRRIEANMLKCFELRDYFVNKVNQAPQLQLMQAAQTNIVVFRFVDVMASSDYSKEENDRLNGINTSIQQQIFEQGEVFVSRTTLAHTKYKPQSIVVLRAVFINPEISPKDIDYVLEEIVKIGQQINTTR